MIIHEDSKSMYDEFCAKVRGVVLRDQPRLSRGVSLSLTQPNPT
jgi:hypothetical protein